MATTKPQTKSAKVIKLLSRTKGATLGEICKATNWQKHSVRAFLTGLRKKGFGLARETAKALPPTNMLERRKFLLAHEAKVQMSDDAVKISLSLADRQEPIEISVKAKLVGNGSDLRLALAPDNGPAKHEPDPVLLRLVVNAFAARDFSINGTASPLVSDYSQRHLRKLAKLSFLAPDIIKAIVQGSQPVDLTGRRFLRAGKIPLDWQEQQTLFGSNRAKITRI